MNTAQLSRLDLNLLVLFQVVFEEGHLGRAARRLHVTPSAVSHGLRRLRKSLNDPLFLRTPKGVVPTERAVAVSETVADILLRVQGVLNSAEAFDPASSRRRFVVGAPDALLASVMLPLQSVLDRRAPNVDLGLVHLMPDGRDGVHHEPWSGGLSKLESREIDVAILPVPNVPARFTARVLFTEDFVVGMRRGHTLEGAMTPQAFRAAGHLLVSTRGDAYGFVDELLAKEGLTRRVVLTVPTFMMALAHISSSDLIGVLPRSLVKQYANSFALGCAELPVRRDADAIAAVSTRAAMNDRGIAWLVGAIAELAPGR